MVFVSLSIHTNFKYEEHTQKNCHLGHPLKITGHCILILYLEIHIKCIQCIPISIQIITRGPISKCGAISISMFFFLVFSKAPHRLRSFSQKSSEFHSKLFIQPSQTTQHWSHQNWPHETFNPTGTVRLRHPQTLWLQLEQPIVETFSPSPKRCRNQLSHLSQVYLNGC